MNISSDGQRDLAVNIPKSVKAPRQNFVCLELSIISRKDMITSPFELIGLLFNWPYEDNSSEHVENFSSHVVMVWLHVLIVSSKKFPKKINQWSDNYI